MTSAASFSKILIANRGEIALRVMRTARAHGFRTVAVYSSADISSRHVVEADQAVWIGEAAPSQSYLNIPGLIDAAAKSGADAVHPGYGFLAENAAFSRACRDAGLAFIGPTPESIAAMGDKAGAKRLMLAAGVPCIPGYQGDDQSEGRLAAEAEAIGYPVMIKARSGGGGRGMRLVAAKADFVERLRSARTEAENAFGDPSVILERAILKPRHIEIQVFGDRHGNAIHLGERDCSVQRRHQKIIEEAPSPAVSEKLRERMGAVAVTAVKSLRYEGAGTLEFLLDADGNFYFMEMNTRLQVEHPVTEAITGLDLVEWQLRIAAGEPLPLKQEDIHFRGHAMEARLCAEDAGNAFMPQSGTISLWRPPHGLRTEHALKSGAEIPPYYDFMIAKLISHGATREEARRKLARGLEDMVALGVKTNQGFLLRCIEHPVFADGGATTAFVNENQGDLSRRDDATEVRARALAAALLLETAANAAHRGAGRRLSHPLPVATRFALNGKVVAATLGDLGGRKHRVTIDRTDHELDVVEIGDHAVRFICDGLMESAVFLRDGARLLLRYRGEAYEIEDTTRAAGVRRAEGPGDGKLRALMNGRVVAVFTAVGDRIEAGAPVLSLEAMKMVHVHAAPVAGVVKALHVAMGDQASANRVVAEIDPDEPGKKP